MNRDKVHPRDPGTRERAPFPGAVTLSGHEPVLKIAPRGPRISIMVPERSPNGRMEETVGEAVMSPGGSRR